MPYIHEKYRGELDFSERGPENAGELNYKLTRTILDYMAHKPLTYSLLNEVMGVLECCKQEFYRRPVADYENKKLDLNGDVY